MPFPLLALLIQLAVGIGLQVLGYLIMPKSATTQPEETQDMDAPTAESRPIPVIFGEKDVSPNVLWYGDKVTTSRKVSS